MLRDRRYGLEFAIDGATLGALRTGSQPAKLDEAGLRAVLASWAEQIDIEPRDARLRFNPTTSLISVLQRSPVHPQPVAVLPLPPAHNKWRATRQHRRMTFIRSAY